MTFYPKPCSLSSFLRVSWNHEAQNTANWFASFHTCCQISTSAKPISITIIKKKKAKLIFQFFTWLNVLRMCWRKHWNTRTQLSANNVSVNLLSLFLKKSLPLCLRIISSSKFWEVFFKRWLLPNNGLVRSQSRAILRHLFYYLLAGVLMKILPNH